MPITQNELNASADRLSVALGISLEAMPPPPQPSRFLEAAVAGIQENPLLLGLADRRAEPFAPQTLGEQVAYGIPGAIPDLAVILATAATLGAAGIGVGVAKAAAKTLPKFVAKQVTPAAAKLAIAFGATGGAKTALAGGSSLEVAEEAVKSSVIGGAFGRIGDIYPIPKGKALAEKPIKRAAAEIATLAIGAPALDLRTPGVVDFVMASTMVGGFTGVNIIASKLGVMKGTTPRTEVDGARDRLRARGFRNPTPEQLSRELTLEALTQEAATPRVLTLAEEARSRLATERGVPPISAISPTPTTLATGELISPPPPGLPRPKTRPPALQPNAQKIIAELKAKGIKEPTKEQVISEVASRQAIQDRSIAVDQLIAMRANLDGIRTQIVKLRNAQRTSKREFFALGGVTRLGLLSNQAKGVSKRLHDYKLKLIKQGVIPKGARVTVNSLVLSTGDVVSPSRPIIPSPSITHVPGKAESAPSAIIALKEQIAKEKAPLPEVTPPLDFSNIAAQVRDIADTVESSVTRVELIRASEAIVNAKSANEATTIYAALSTDAKDAMEVRVPDIRASFERATPVSIEAISSAPPEKREGIGGFQVVGEANVPPFTLSKIFNKDGSHFASSTRYIAERLANFPETQDAAVEILTKYSGAIARGEVSVQMANKNAISELRALTERAVRFIEGEELPETGESKKGELPEGVGAMRNETRGRHLEETINVGKRAEPLGLQGEKVPSTFWTFVDGLKQVSPTRAGFVRFFAPKFYTLLRPMVEMVDRWERWGARAKFNPVQTIAKTTDFSPEHKLAIEGLWATMNIERTVLKRGPATELYHVTDDALRAQGFTEEMIDHVFTVQSAMRRYNWKKVIPAMVVAGKMRISEAKALIRTLERENPSWMPHIRGGRYHWGVRRLVELPDDAENGIDVGRFTVGKEGTRVARKGTTMAYGMTHTEGDAITTASEWLAEFKGSISFRIFLKDEIRPGMGVPFLHGEANAVVQVYGQSGRVVDQRLFKTPSAAKAFVTNADKQGWYSPDKMESFTFDIAEAHGSSDPAYTVSVLQALPMVKSLGLKVAGENAFITEKQVIALTDALQTRYVNIAAGGHLAPRKGTPGYEISTASLISFYDVFTASIARMVWKPRVLKVIETIPTKKGWQKSAYESLEYMENIRAYEGFWNNATRTGLYVYFLGLKPAFAILNWTQRILMTYPAIVEATGGIGSATKIWWSAEKATERIMFDFVKAKVKGDKFSTLLDVIKADKHLSEGERNQLVLAVEEGAVAALRQQEIAGGMSVAPVGTKLLRTIDFFGWYSEVSNRVHGTLSAAKLHEAGYVKKGMALSDFRAQFNARANILYSIANRPGFAKGVLAPVTIFKTFPSNYIAFMMELYKGNKKAFYSAMATATLLGGVAGLPAIAQMASFIDAMMSGESDNPVLAAARQRFGFSSATYLIEKARMADQLKDNTFTRALFYGTPSLAGINAPLHFGAVGEGIFTPAPFSILTSFANVGRVAFEKDVPIGKLVQATAPIQFRKMLQAHNMILTGEFPTDIYGKRRITISDIEKSPQVVRPEFMAFYKEIPFNATPLDIAIVGVGFQSLRQGEFFRKVHAIQAGRRIAKAQIADLNRLYARAVFDNDVAAQRRYLKQSQDKNMPISIASVNKHIQDFSESPR